MNLFRGGSRTDETSKMERFVIIVNGLNLKLEVKVGKPLLKRKSNICISNCLQEFFNDIDILPDTSIDHSPLLISLLNNKSDKNDNGFSKLNNSLVCDKFYIENMKKKKKSLQKIII